MDVSHKTRTFTVRLAVTTNTIITETVLQQMCWLDVTTQDSSQSVPSEDLL